MSTRQTMRLIALVALNMALFQGAWFILVVPSITMLWVILNATLYSSWVRRERLSGPLLVAMLVGLAVALMLGMAMVSMHFKPLLDWSHRWVSGSFLNELPDPIFGISRPYALAFVLLDATGFGAMLGAGWAVALFQRSRSKEAVRRTG